MLCSNFLVSQNHLYLKIILNFRRSNQPYSDIIFSSVHQFFFFSFSVNNFIFIIYHFAVYYLQMQRFFCCFSFFFFIFYFLCPITICLLQVVFIADNNITNDNEKKTKYIKQWRPKKTRACCKSRVESQKVTLKNIIMMHVLTRCRWWWVMLEVFNCFLLSQIYLAYFWWYCFLCLFLILFLCKFTIKLKSNF